jgi:hypothetical protein
MAFLKSSILEALLSSALNNGTSQGFNLFRAKAKLIGRLCHINYEWPIREKSCTAFADGTGSEVVQERTGNLKRFDSRSRQSFFNLLSEVLLGPCFAAEVEEDRLIAFLDGNHPTFADYDVTVGRAFDSKYTHIITWSDYPQRIPRIFRQFRGLFKAFPQTSAGNESPHRGGCAAGCC